jgi:predicted lipid-binding transport protein (Tim44 family)
MNSPLNSTGPRLSMGNGFRPAGAERGVGHWLSSLFGFLATGVAVVIGALLAVFAAAAVTVIALVGSVLVFLAGLALRARRGAAYARPTTVLEARKVGHAWVTYGWDRTGR